MKPNDDFIFRQYGSGCSAFTWDADKIYFPVCLRSGKMVDDYNYRKSEADSFLEAYLTALPKHLKLPENYKLVRDQKRGLMEQWLNIERTVSNTPESYAMGGKFDYDKFLPKWDQEAVTIKQLFENAHAATIAEVSEPKEHGQNGKPLQTGKFQDNFRKEGDEKSDIRGKRRAF